MNFSERWLRKWVNPLITTTELCNQLTKSGLEVEQLINISKLFSNILIGEIITIHKIIVNNIKYYSYIVHIKNFECLKIVSKKNDCNIGEKVLVANDNTILANGKIVENYYPKGIKTEGIFCSFLHLGLFPFDNNIVKLPNDVSIHSDVKKLSLFNDTIIKININTNRLDQFSILGISREIAAINKLSLPKLTISSPKIMSDKKVNVYSQLSFNNFIYLGRVLENINVKIQTPFWILNKLFKCHISSKNVVQDIINFVLIEIGEPLHAINLESIDSNTVYLQQIPFDKKIYLDDEKEVILKKNTIIIQDSLKVLILGNNINTKYSKINENTKNIFLGTLYLNFFEVNNSIKRSSINNKIINFYQYSVDMNLQKYAIEYATMLILDICGGKAGLLTNVNVMQDDLLIRTIIKLKYKNIKRILGENINKKIIKKILLRLGYDIVADVEYQVLVRFPKWRTDILIEEDVINDILRIYGLNKISKRYVGSIDEFFKNNDTTYCTLKKAKNILVNKGYYESINYSFINPKLQSIIVPYKQPLFINNPISEDMSVMRLSLLPGLLTNIIYNENRQQVRLRFFESGLCFIPDKKADMEVRQKLFLSGVVNGNLYQKYWNLSNRKVDFYDVKGDIESVLELYSELNNIQFKLESFSSLYPGKSAAIYINKKNIGKIGFLHPKIRKQLNLKQEVIVFELCLEDISNKNIKKINKVSEFPSSKRDISIILPKRITFDEVLSECKKISPKKIFDINIFDVYFGSSLSLEKKSFTISFIFQDLEKTLEEKEIDIIFQKCVKMLRSRFQATLRY